MRRSWRIVGLVLAPLVLLGVWSMRSRAGEGAATAVPTPAEAAAEAAATAISTPAEAAAQAVAFTGLPETAVASVEERTVSDPMSPVWEVKDMLVWEVVFDGISFTVPQPEGEPLANPNLHSVTVWLDPETGAPVKIATPHPTEGGLTLIVSKETGRLSGVEESHLELRMSAVLPEKPLSAVAVAGRPQQECTLGATEMVAYYGLLTYRLGAETLIADKPVWLVYYAGLAEARIYAFSGGPAPLDGTSRPTVYASEMLLMMDATSGKGQYVHNVGRPD